MPRQIHLFIILVVALQGCRSGHFETQVQPTAAAPTFSAPSSEPQVQPELDLQSLEVNLKSQDVLSDSEVSSLLEFQVQSSSVTKNDNFSYRLQCETKTFDGAGIADDKFLEFEISLTRGRYDNEIDWLCDLEIKASEQNLKRSLRLNFERDPLRPLISMSRRESKDLHIRTSRQREFQKINISDFEFIRTLSLNDPLPTHRLHIGLAIHRTTPQGTKLVMLEGVEAKFRLFGLDSESRILDQAVDLNFHSRSDSLGKFYLETHLTSLQLDRLKVWIVAVRLPKLETTEALSVFRLEAGHQPRRISIETLAPALQAELQDWY